MKKITKKTKDSSDTSKQDTQAFELSIQTAIVFKDDAGQAIYLFEQPEQAQEFYRKYLKRLND